MKLFDEGNVYGRMIDIFRYDLCFLAVVVYEQSVHYFEI